MRQLTISAMSALLAATAGAAEPLRVGIVWVADENTQTVAHGPVRTIANHLRGSMKRNCDALPKALAGRPVRTQIVLIGQDPPELDIYDVVVVLPELAPIFPHLDKHAKAFHDYVRRGGGLVVFQPNPLATYPPNSPAPLGVPDDANAAQRTTPKFLPLPVTFYNWYVKGEGVKVVDRDHPITSGLGDAEMPFPADRMLGWDKRYKVLAMGMQSQSPSLLAAEFGKGRIVLCGDNVAGTSFRGAASTVTARVLLWAAGGKAQQVRQVVDERAGIWPTARSAKAIQDGTLRLKVIQAAREIDTFQRVDLVLTMENTGKTEVDLPDAWLLGVEIVSDGKPTVRYTWWPEQAVVRTAGALAPGRDSGRLHTCHWMAKMPLQGRPEEWPYLVPGTYRFRLKHAGAPELASDWQPLEVRAGRLSEAARAAMERRPKGKLILVDPERPCPAPTGSPERPFQYLREAIRHAQCGDVVFCEPGQHYCEDMTVPDGVWLVGAGAGATSLAAGSRSKNMPAPIELCGQSRLEGFTIGEHPVDKGAGYFIRATGAEARAVVYQCAILPPDYAFSGLTAWQKASLTLQNCLVVSPVGDYGVFARNGARLTIEHCTIISRGFGVGLMDGAGAIIRRSIIAGRTPAIIRSGPACPIDLADSVVWCPRVADQFPHAIVQWAVERVECQNGKTESRIYYVAVPDAMKSPALHSFDPRFGLGKTLRDWLAVPDSSDAAAYGAFSGKGGDWGKAQGKPVPCKLPDLRPYVAASGGK